MKINSKLYFCPWCEMEFRQTVNRVEGQGGKGVGVDQCICLGCNRYVSQKTKLETESKKDGS